MRAYHDENDSDSFAPSPVAPGPGTAKGGARKGGRATAAGKGLAAKTPRARAKGRGKAAVRSRSRSPDDSSADVRTRSSTFTPMPDDDDDGDDLMEGLGPIASFNSGIIDPDNLPGYRRIAPAPPHGGYVPAVGTGALDPMAPAPPAAPGTGQAAAKTPRQRRNKGGKVGGSIAGRKIHMWTEEENTALGEAGVRVTKGLSTWAEEWESGDLPLDVSMRACRDRYFRMRRKGALPSGK